MVAGKMKRQYMRPVVWTSGIMPEEMVAASGPGAGEQRNPGIKGSRSWLWEDDWEDEEVE
jgi:hypothetical protein